MGSRGDVRCCDRSPVFPVSARFLERDWLERNGYAAPFSSRTQCCPIHREPIALLAGAEFPGSVERGDRIARELAERGGGFHPSRHTHAARTNGDSQSHSHSHSQSNADPNPNAHADPDPNANPDSQP